MTNVHGKLTYVSLNGSDLSAFSKNLSSSRSADSHDVTTFGSNAHKFAGGLLNGTVNIDGIYDNTTSGPHDIIEPLIGTNVTLVYRIEGTGSGRPNASVEVLVGKYEETAPVDDMVQWTVELQMSGDLTSTNQA